MKGVVLAVNILHSTQVLHSDEKYASMRFRIDGEGSLPKLAAMLSSM